MVFALPEASMKISTTKVRKHLVCVGTRPEIYQATLIVKERNSRVLNRITKAMEGTSSMTSNPSPDINLEVCFP